MSDRVRSFAPLSLLGLAACGGGGGEDGGGQPIARSVATVKKGLLQNALVVVDRNDNGRHDAGEASTRTDSRGRFDIANPDGAPILVLTDAQTIDSASGRALPGLRLGGSATATTITPFTDMSGVDTSALATALGLPGVNLLNYDVGQLGVEKVSQQMVGTLRVLAGVMDGAGRSGSDTELFGQAFDALTAVVRDQLAQGHTFAFGDEAILTAVITQLGLNGTLTPAQRTGLIQQLQELNSVIDNVSALGSDTAKGAFSTATRLADTYGQSIDAGNGADVNAIAKNLPPLITPGSPLVVKEADLAEGTQTVGSVQISDDAPGVTVELTGANANLFTITATGTISVRAGAQIDFASDTDLPVTVRVTDAQGAVTTRTVQIARQPNETPTLSIAPQGGTFSVDETSIPNGDRDVGTITATDPDGHALNLSLTGTDAALFEIDGTTLRLTADAVIDGTRPLSVTVTASDAVGAKAQQTLSVAVDQNRAPTLTIDAGGGASVDETLRIDGDRLAATITATDPEGEAVALSLSGTDAGLFEIGADNKIVLRADAVVDFDTKPKLSVTVTATDGSGHATSQELEIAVNEVAQSDLEGLADTSIQGNRSYGSTLTIVNGLSDPDNGADPKNFASVEYQWYLRATGSEKFTAVEGATAINFDTTQDMLNKFVAAVITTEDQGGQVDRTIVFFGTVLPPPEQREAPLKITLNAQVDQARIDLRADLDQMESGLSAFTKSISALLDEFSGVLANDAILGAANPTLTAEGDLAINLAAQGAGVTHKIEVDFDNLAIQTFEQLETVVNQIDFSDPATLSVAGQINSMSFTSETGTFALSYANPAGGSAQSITISYAPLDANGNPTGADGDVQQINLTGTFANGLEPILKSLSAANAVADLNAPKSSDFADAAAFQAAQAAYQTAYQDAIASALTALLGGGGETAVAGLEGIEVSTRSGGTLKTQFALDLFRADGTGLTATLGEYQLTIDGTLPSGPADLIPLFQPTGGIFATINALLAGDGGLTLADFNALVEGSGGNAGLKAAGFEDIDTITLKRNDGTGTYKEVLKVDVDLAELAAVWDDFDVDKEITEQFAATADRGVLSVAHDVDGVYLVLGEGLEMDDLQTTLTWLLPQTDAAVAS